MGAGVGLFAIDERPVTAESDARIAGYERVDLQAFYNGFASWRVALTVRNVFDEKYIESMEFPGRLNHFGSPRAALLRAEYRFGR